MGRFFSVQELTASTTARKYGIDNTPTDAEIIKHIEELIIFLDEVRAAWGGPLIVTSGYRCPKLNAKVGGSKTSVHPLGYAADIKPANNQMDKFIAFITEWSKDKQFDQILLERNNKGARWCHIGLYNREGKQRKQVKTLKVK